MIRVEDGEITYIDRASGHYKPSEENFHQAVEILKPHCSSEVQVVSEVVWEHACADLFQSTDDAW